jgi:hypothetical protein
LYCAAQDPFTWSIHGPPGSGLFALLFLYL